LSPCDIQYKHSNFQRAEHLSRGLVYAAALTTVFLPSLQKYLINRFDPPKEHLPQKILLLGKLHDSLPFYPGSTELGEDLEKEN
jgi:hypothetical protein